MSTENCSKKSSLLFHESGKARKKVIVTILGVVALFAVVVLHIIFKLDKDITEWAIKGIMGMVIGFNGGQAYTDASKGK